MAGVSGVIKGIADAVEGGIKGAWAGASAAGKTAGSVAGGFLDTPIVNETMRTAGSIIDNSPILRGARESFLPNLKNKNMDIGERVGLSKGWIAAAAISTPFIAAGTAGYEATYKPYLQGSSPPPTSFYDGNGDLRHVNDMGAGPAFARSVMGSK